MASCVVASVAPSLSAERQRLAVLASAIRRWENKSPMRYNSVVLPLCDDGLSIPSRVERSLVNVTANPILYALKVEAREIGWSLFMRGGVPLMRRLLEGQPPKLLSFLTTSWIGVGGWGGPLATEQQRAAA